MRLDNAQSLAAVKEVFFWQDTYDNKGYPLYNPMSKIASYRSDQDLFLENASYLKLRTLTVGYTLPLKTKREEEREKGKISSPENLHFYLTANNLLTFTGFKDGDPETAGFYGIYDGYGQKLPLSIMLGIKFNF